MIMHNEIKVVKKIVNTIVCILVIISYSKSYSQEKKYIHPLIYKYLTSDEIEKLNEADIKKLNFYFDSSYTVDKTNPDFIRFVNDSGGIFDVTKIERFRKEDKISYFKSENYPSLKIQLMPRKELEMIYEKIK